MSDRTPADESMRFRDTLFLILAGIFVASLVACNLIFLKFFQWTPVGSYTFTLSVGLLPYPITFLCTDVISELYGRRKANIVVLSGFVCSLYVVGILLVAGAVPAMEGSAVDDATFQRVFGLAPAAVFASMMAYLIAQFVDIRVFHFWKRVTRGKHLWLRNNGSTIFSQLIDSATVIGLLCLLEGHENPVFAWENFTPLVANAFLFKVMVALADTPFFYAAVMILKPAVHDDPDEAAWRAAEGESTAREG